MLPFTLPECTIDSVEQVASLLLIRAHTQSPGACCPHCQHLSHRIHSRYVRTPRDLPVSEPTVRLQLRVRRFFCDQPACPKRTFVERLPDIVPFHGQRTIRLTRSLRVLGFAIGGEAGARVGTQLSMPVSAATLLRVIRNTPLSSCAPPRVLGVDDFAFLKGHVYGTILVDLEQHQPVDLLPDRTADTLAAWLRCHTGVEIITRDRSTEYARGARDGAPTAVQIVDRWHLLQNLREALERMLNRLHGELRQLPTAQDGITSPIPEAAVAVRPLHLPSPREQAGRAARRDRRSARYHMVRDLYAQGMPLLQIAKRLGMSRSTVRTFASAADFPERAQPVRASGLDSYLVYLHQRWIAGCTNSSELWRELHAQGYQGTHKQVARWVQHQRQTSAATTPRKYVRTTVSSSAKASSTSAEHEVMSGGEPLAAPRQLVWLLLREQAGLDAEEARAFTRIVQHPQVAQAYDLTKMFQTMVRKRTASELTTWLLACGESGIADLQSFAAGLERDDAAVRAALTEVWSNGQTEGQVTRLKLVKRQMYGRAKFDLLRQRVLAA